MTPPWRPSKAFCAKCGNQAVFVQVVDDAYLYGCGECGAAFFSQFVPLNKRAYPFGPVHWASAEQTAARDQIAYALQFREAVEVCKENKWRIDYRTEYGDALAWRVWTPRDVFPFVEVCRESLPAAVAAALASMGFIQEGGQ
jgi:ribosomal protein S27AE